MARIRKIRHAYNLVQGTVFLFLAVKTSGGDWRTLHKFEQFVLPLCIIEDKHGVAFIILIPLVRFLYAQNQVHSCNAPFR